MGGVYIMTIIINKSTKKEKSRQTNRLFPKGDIPNIICDENEEIIRIDDESELAKKIELAYDYYFIFNEKGTPIDINVIKTLEEYKNEQVIIREEFIEKETLFLQKEITKLYKKNEELELRLSKLEGV
jgi:hypothetical protein